ncbi:hypothetical protein J1614_004347 [Plenodomus biglobosus]|nr:hypothetical protein J1614_004347 [Plenodomus biglobosus]
MNGYPACLPEEFLRLWGSNQPCEANCRKDSRHAILCYSSNRTNVCNRADSWKPLPIHGWLCIEIDVNVTPKVDLPKKHCRSHGMQEQRDVELATSMPKHMEAQQSCLGDDLKRQLTRAVPRILLSR